MELTEGWEVACTPPGRVSRDRRAGAAGLDARRRVPGTAAGAVGRRRPGLRRRGLVVPVPLHGAEPEWLDARRAIELDGIATVGEVHLNGERVLEFDSMWESHEIDVAGAPATPRTSS